MTTYKDKIRKVGSQSEIPKIVIKDNNLMVSGYQIFNINITTKKITLMKYNYKFIYINSLLNQLKKEDCDTFIDIGCSSGLTSLLAHNNNYRYIVSVDHDPEYINTLTLIKQCTSITNINESVYSFGDVINEKYDVVFCGAIIHWIFSLTADFRNFDSIISYLNSFTKKYLIIEWVDNNDMAINCLNHIKKRGKPDDEEYNTENFEKAVKKYMNIISIKPVCGDTRIIYLLKPLDN